MSELYVQEPDRAGGTRQKYYLTEQGKELVKAFWAKHSKEEIPQLLPVKKISLYRWFHEKDVAVSSRGRQAVDMIEKLTKEAEQGQKIDLSQVTMIELIQELKRRGAKDIVF